VDKKGLDPNGHAVHTDPHMSQVDIAPDQIVSLATSRRNDLTVATGVPTDRTRVLVADPDPLARRALTDALREDGGFLVIGQAADAVETVELACHYRPELVLLAAHLPNADAIAICERIVLASATTRVVMLATSPDVELEMRAVRAGASGYVVKSDEIESIGRALSVVMAGHAIVSPELTAVLVDRLRRTPEGGAGTRPVKSTLTDREWEVLDLICGGATTREIADALYLSPETVNSHAKSVLKKLGVHSRAAAVETASMLRGELLA
jgi:NarL family two-component system response regulator LiaR